MSETAPVRELVVVGAGPGGYAAAFHAADLGISTTLIDPEEHPGGVCLYRGCIPSKALLQVAHLVHGTREAADWGLRFAPPEIDLERLRSRKEEVVGKLTGGLSQLRRARGVEHVRGSARFLDARTIAIEEESGERHSIRFRHAIVATGSAPHAPAGLDVASPRIWDSTAALDLPEIPERLLVVGGGYIGLELGSVYAALGSRVTVVEILDRLLAGVDPDLVRPLQRVLSKELEEILLETRVLALVDEGETVKARLEGKGGELERSFDRALVAVGRKPRSDGLGLEQTAVERDAQGHIRVDSTMRTGEQSIFAIGDVVGQPMLAHKASHEARVAVETIAGRKAAFDPAAIPAVVFTDPEVAWCGLTEDEAKRRGVEVQVTRFPWAASGRAATLGVSEGLTKLLIDPATERIRGVGLVGRGAGELIAEGVLAIEMAALASDLKLTIHPHPTLSETLMEAAELFFGQSTHLKRTQR